MRRSGLIKLLFRVQEKWVDKVWQWVQDVSQHSPGITSSPCDLSKWPPLYLQSSVFWENFKSQQRNPIFCFQKLLWRGIFSSKGHLVQWSLVIESFLSNPQQCLYLTSRKNITAIFLHCIVVIRRPLLKKRKKEIIFSWKCPVVSGSVFCFLTTLFPQLLKRILSHSLLALVSHYII